MTREQRRAVLLEVGRNLFAERGYHGTSVGDIAREARCSEAVLYQHFDGKPSNRNWCWRAGRADALAPGRGGGGRAG